MSVVTREQAFLDHLAAGGGADPTPFYARLRREAPVFWTPSGFWFLTTYALAEQYYQGDKDFDSLWTKDSKKAKNTKAGQGALSSGGGYAATFFQSEIHHRDGADHARLRRLLNKPFRPRAVANLGQSIERVISDLLDEIAAAGDKSELIESFAFQIPTRVIMDLLGMPAEHTKLMVEIATSVIASREPGTTGWLERADSIFEAGHFVLLDLLNQRRRAPQDDVMTQYAVASAGERDSMTDIEWTMNLMFLLVAGHETTANVIGSTIYELLASPDQLALLQANPELIDNAVEEALRMRPPVRMSSPRWALEDMELEGMKIARGDEVNVSIVAANRDPAIFADPDRFMITRETNPHYAFAPGSTHYCLGAALARLETKLAVEMILRRFPRLRLDGDIVWKNSFVVWGPAALNIRI